MSRQLKLTKTKVLLFSVTAEDCEWQTFRAGGKGGQHQNKTETGVRCLHKPSGAVAEARDSRSQRENKIAAFSRLVMTREFQRWHKAETSRRLLNYSSIESMVEASVSEQMAAHNIQTEVKNAQNQWIQL